MESPHNNFILSNMYLFQNIAFPEISIQSKPSLHLLNPDHYKFQIFKDILWIKTKYEGRREGKGLTPLTLPVEGRICHPEKVQSFEVA